MHSKNHSTSEIYNDLFLIKIMNAILNFKVNYQILQKNSIFVLTLKIMFLFSIRLGIYL